MNGLPTFTISSLLTMATKSRESGFPVASPGMVTPELAAHLLVGHDNYRNLRPSKVDQYARDMADGNWSLNGSTVVLDSDLELIDAQHRLSASVKSGEPFATFIVVGIDKARSVATMDTGLKRVASDVLSHQGVKNATTITSAANADTRGRRSAVNMSTSETLAWVDEHPGIHAGASKCWRLIQPSHRVPAGAAALFTMWALAIDAELTEDFLDGVGRGADLAETDARFVLRRLLMTRATERQRPSRVVYVALLVKAWNAYVQDRPIRNLGWKRTEQFPTMLDALGVPVDMDNLGTEAPA